MRSHRQLFPTPLPTNESISCPDNLCLDPVCPFGDCYPYPDPPSPPIPPKPDQPIKISPLLIVVIAVVSTLVVLITYFFIVLRRRTSPVRRNASEANSQIEGDMDDGDESQGLVEHHVWLINTVGLQQSVINRISVVKYRRGEGVIEGTDCSVCLSEFREGETLRLLPKCSHAFHVGCIDTWLRSHTNCPMCRAGIVVSGIAGPSLASSDRSFGNSRRNEVGRVIDPEISEVELANGDGVSEEFAEIAVGRVNGIDGLAVDRNELKRVRRCASMGYMNSGELMSAESSWRFVQPLQGSRVSIRRSRSSGARLHEIHDRDSLLKFPA